MGRQIRGNPGLSEVSNLFVVLLGIASASQQLEPPANPRRFTHLYKYRLNNAERALRSGGKVHHERRQDVVAEP
jgi:hypothetical protein